MGSGRSVTRVYIPYWEWEEFHSGMWRTLPKDQEQEAIEQAVIFTGDYIKYGEAMGEAIEAWPRTMLNSLTNSAINRRAFLGHCAVQYKIGIPEYITRTAWGMLTDSQRELADLAAQNHIDKYLCKIK